ncbi:NAD(+)-dependent homoserine dehydrogenase [Candidatus Magnetomoraceae bacterium gMMP-1]
MKEINVGILGFGIVGTGVTRILIENKDVISSRLGAALNLKSVADIDITTDRGISLEKGVLITDGRKVINDPEIDIIVETIGGDGIAREFILEAIQNKKQVVTANKALLAEKGWEIFQKASEQGVDIGFEASIGGCIPIIKTLREALVGNRIQYMNGILNGTCNYILSKISEEGSSFEEALAGAQKKGYAEADPTLDVEGFDAAHKLAIFTTLAYGTEVNFDDIYVEGISKITPMDIEIANEFGYIIKLLAISKELGDSIQARVHPAMIPSDKLLSKVGGSVNALNIIGDAVGDIVLYGRGAGMMPTASSIISDIVDLARNILTRSKGRVPTLSYQMENIKKIPIQPIKEIISRYYFRFAAMDRPGVLSKIAGVLGHYDISIQSVHQKGRGAKKSVPIVMLTHRAKEADVLKALNEIEGLDVVCEKPVLIRIEESYEE